jgi:pimeloyl-ACP methyl ester carboxylesterase
MAVILDTAATGPSLDEVKKEMLRRANGRISPFEAVKKEDTERVVAELASLDRDHWASLWSKLAAGYEAEADKLAASAGKAHEAAEAYYMAFDYFRLARYPAATTPGKQKAYRDSLRAFHKAARYFDPPLEVVEIPYADVKLNGYLQVPRGVAKPPVVLQWGGVDGWKEDRVPASKALNRLGIATMSIDMPGTGENPLRYIDPRAQGSFSAWIDYLVKRADIDGSRIACWGGSFGGYWAARLAYAEPTRLRGAVFQGGSVHFGLQRDWLIPALTKTASTYLFGPSSLLEARSAAMGVDSLEALLDEAAKLSLVTLGMIDKPSCTILGVNGKLDDQAPVQDIYLLMEHGRPKEARVFPKGGHMGRTPGMDAAVILGVITNWLAERLSA